MFTSERPEALSDFPVVVFFPHSKFPTLLSEGNIF